MSVGDAAFVSTPASSRGHRDLCRVDDHVQSIILSRCTPEKPGHISQHNLTVDIEFFTLPTPSRVDPRLMAVDRSVTTSRARR